MSEFTRSDKRREIITQLCCHFVLHFSNSQLIVFVLDSDQIVEKEPKSQIFHSEAWEEENKNKRRENLCYYML